MEIFKGYERMKVSVKYSTSIKEPPPMVSFIHRRRFYSFTRIIFGNSLE